MGDRETDNLPRGVEIHRGKLRIAFVYRGVRCREGLGIDPTKANVQFARRKRDVVLHEIALGTFVYQAHFPNSKRALIFGARPAANLTVRTMLTNWLEIMRPPRCAPSTYRDYKSAVEYHLIPAFGEMLGTAVKKSDVKRWLATLTCSNKRKNNLLIPLRGAYQDAVDDELIERSPVENLRNLEVRQDEPDPFSLDEIDIMLRHFDGQARNLFQFAVWSGLRTSELIALAWEDIDFNRETVRVTRASVRKTLKGSKSAAGERDVELLPGALSALQAQKTHTYMMRQKPVEVWRDGVKKRERIRPVFYNPRTGEPWETDQQIRKTCWNHGIRRSGIRYRTPYQTRHTFASLLLSLGANPMWVAQQMGHKDWGMIRKRYGRWIKAMGSQQRDLIVTALGTHSAPTAPPAKSGIHEKHY